MNPGNQIHARRMENPLHLPVSLLAEVLVEWLSISSVVQLDSATCSTKFRPSFLAVVQSEFSRHDNAPVLNTHGHAGIAQWMVLRGVKTNRADIFGNRSFDLDVTVTILRSCGPILTSLCLCDCTQATSSAIFDSLAATSSHLRFLKLNRCSDVDSGILGTLISNCAPTLGRLSLEDVTTSGSLVLSRFPNLEMLHVQRSSVDMTAMRQLIMSSPRLRSFSFDNLGYSVDCLNALAAHSPLLQVLCYENGSANSVDSLVCVLQACPNIEVVNVLSVVSFNNMSTTVRDATIAAVLQHCRNLKAFGVPSLETVMSAESLQVLAARLPDLHHLYLDNCAPASNATVLALTQDCHNLRSLDLSAHNDFVSEAALVALISNLQNVVELRVSQCDWTDPVLIAIGAHCPLLQVLNLCSYSEYTDAGIEAVVRGCPALKRVLLWSGAEDWLALCPGLDIEEMDEPSNVWAAIRHLDRKEFVVW